jgi:hypothetical protein
MQMCNLSMRSAYGGTPYFAGSRPLQVGETVPSFWDNSEEMKGEPNGYCPDLFPPLDTPVPAPLAVSAVHAPRLPGKGWSWRTGAQKAKRDRFDRLHRDDLVPIDAPIPTRFPLPDMLDVLVSGISRMEIERPAESDASTSGSHRPE